MTDGTTGTGGTGASPPVGTAGAGGAAGGAGANVPWYGDRIDETTRGFWQNKGIDPGDPVMVATKLTEFYRAAEGKIGAPPEEIIRIPKANASETDIKAYWGKIGVPAEAKDYDLSAVKRADGKEIQPLADAFRAAAHSARVTKDQAAPLLAAMVKHQEGLEAAALADRTAATKVETDALKQNWGTNFNYNYAVAQKALEDLGKAAGLTPDQTKTAWDALSKVGGVGASYAMEMLRTIGAKMGEPVGLINGQPSGPSGVMSQAQAKARMDELKMDNAWYARLKAGGTAEKREWLQLQTIAFPSQRPAA